jgi:hypothetical protein
MTAGRSVFPLPAFLFDYLHWPTFDDNRRFFLESSNGAASVVRSGARTEPESSGLLFARGVGVGPARETRDIGQDQK